ncbi:MAG: hypothetical protein BGN88_15625 [Clostridiales bacterium 43-6]|nr:MAG: hypothetical protein BGN88_15625 [Clostridiales bacterium 43-6]
MKNNNERDLVVMEAEEIINNYIKKQSEFSHKFVLKKKKDFLIKHKYLCLFLMVSAVLFYFWLK